MQAMLGLGSAGFSLVWGAGPLGELRPGMMGGRNGSRLAKFIPVAPKPEAADEVGRQVPPATAGEEIREDLQRLGLSPVMDADVPDPVSPRGLAWRVPRPRWKIAAPQCQLSSPRWKVALLLF